jgi:hypothetical protein
LPAIVVEDFTWNLIQLSTGVISKTGACARVANDKQHVKTQTAANRMPHRVCSHTSLSITAQGSA